MVSYSITGNSIDRCSGGCKYCSAAASMNYRMWLNTHNIEEELHRIDDQTYETYRADYSRLTEALDHDITVIKKQKLEGNIMSVDVWGGDPVTSFKYLQDITEFLEDYTQERGMTLRLHTSTNGMPLIRNDIFDYIHEHKIGIQLSHDGWGQHMRTDDFDPVLEIENLRTCIRDGTCNWINTTLNFWNYSLLANRRYWLGILKGLFPSVFDDNRVCSEEEDRVYRGLFIKLNHIYNGDYDIRAINKYGRLNDQEYKQLKDKPYGNVSLHNDIYLAEEYHIPELAHVLDNYIQDWYKAYYSLRNSGESNPYWLPFRNYIEGQCKRYDILKPDSHGNVRSGACHDFQAGITDHTFVLDTTGRYSQCNLIDADHKVLNPTARQPEYCNSCKYKYSRECNSCGSMMPPKKCEYLYRWNQFLESIDGDKSNRDKKCNCSSKGKN